MKTSKAIKILIAVLILALAGTVGGSALYLRRQYERTTYFEGTVINGADVSDKTPEEVEKTIAEAYKAPVITINEDGSEAVKGTLADFGYTLDEDALGADLEIALAQQKSSVLVLIQSLMTGNAFTVNVDYNFDESVFNSKVGAAALPAERVKSVDAELKFDEKNSEYYIQPEVYGNEFDDVAFRKYVREYTDGMVEGKEPASDLTIDFPTELYVQPEKTQNDIDMNNTMNIWNRYSKAKITYDYGEKKEVLDWSTIKDWVQMEDGTLSADALWEYVTNLAATYNTRYYNRTFQTSDGQEIKIDGDMNTYGYTVNEDAEYAQLLADIQNNAATEREPVYYATTTDGYSTPVYYKRNGRDDLAGTYVEVSLTKQHLWFYKNGELIVESDLVSGSVAKKTETHTGVYPIAYKESPSILSGQDGANGYETKVDFWMPFADGQGLHDATWRSSFGGQIYKTSGSHGCVNLPHEAAEKIYENIEPGMAVIVY